MAERLLKVYPKHRIGAEKVSVVPEIRLCGKWLADCGFKSGNNIKVLVEKGRVVITQISENNHV